METPLLLKGGLLIHVTNLGSLTLLRKLFSFHLLDGKKIVALPLCFNQGKSLHYCYHGSGEILP